MNKYIGIICVTVLRYKLIVTNYFFDANIRETTYSNFNNNKKQRERERVFGIILLLNFWVSIPLEANLLLADDTL